MIDSSFGGNYPKVRNLEKTLLNWLLSRRNRGLFGQIDLGESSSIWDGGLNIRDLSDRKPGMRRRKAWPSFKM